MFFCTIIITIVSIFGKKSDNQMQEKYKNNINISNNNGELNSLMARTKGYTTKKNRK